MQIYVQYQRREHGKSKIILLERVSLTYFKYSTKHSKGGQTYFLLHSDSKKKMKTEEYKVGYLRRAKSIFWHQKHDLRQSFLTIGAIEPDVRRWNGHYRLSENRSVKSNQAKQGLQNNKCKNSISILVEDANPIYSLHGYTAACLLYSDFSILKMTQETRWGRVTRAQ